MSLFETATRNNYTFATTAGAVTVQQLWQLPLTHTRSISLNDVAKTINKELRALGEEDFVGGGTASSKDRLQLEIKLEIVKHIIKVKKEEAEIASKKAENIAQVRRLKEILAAKRDAGMQDMSVEDIEEQIRKLS